ncbi:DUF1405 domain-containing protein [Salicibibacter cibi]
MAGLRIVIGFLARPSMLWVLLFINGGGTLYGFYWYEGQLAQTPAYFLPFVPDSPTASLFFTGVLAAFLLRKHIGLLEAFAAVTLMKYGIWAVVMNLGADLMGGPVNWQNYMLIASHFGMALQAVLFLPYYRIKLWHLVVVGIWTVHNDIIDYVFGMHPWVSPALMPYIDHIGYFTFWLGLAAIAIVYIFNVRHHRYRLSLPR